MIDQCVKLLAKQNPVATICVWSFPPCVWLPRSSVWAILPATWPRPLAAPTRPPRFPNPLSRCSRDDRLHNTADQLVAMLSDRDAKTAEAIILADDKLDNLHHQTFDLALSDDITRQQTVDIVLLGRFLERLGDHAVSAARRVVYIVSGFDPTKEPTRDEGTDID